MSHPDAAPGEDTATRDLSSEVLHRWLDDHQAAKNLAGAYVGAVARAKAVRFEALLRRRAAGGRVR